MRFSKLSFLAATILLFLAYGPAMAQISHAPIQPVQFQKAMIFIDGTNLFYRLEAAKIVITNLFSLISPHVGRRDVVRTYLYTIKEQFERAKNIHSATCFDKVRVVFGEGVPTKDGNVKEKGVDALLVADLVYHAANKNCDYALLVTVDADFVQALRRVEDFGCRTGVLAICSEAPDSLRMVCDNYTFLDAQRVLRTGHAMPK